MHSLRQFFAPLLFWRQLLWLGLFVGAFVSPLRAQQVIYITESTYGRVFAYDLNTLQPYNPTSALATTTGLGYYLRAIATDAAGNVYVAYPANGADWIQKFNSSGALVTSFGTNGYTSAAGNAIINSAVVNSAGTRLLLPFNSYVNALQGFDTTTGAAASGFTTITGLSNPGAVTFNPSGSLLYVTNTSGALQGSTITQYSVNGGAGTALTFANGGYFNNGFDNAKGLFFQSDTSMIVVSTSLGALERYTLSGTVATLDTSFGISGAVSINGLSGGIAADASGNLYVVANTSIVQLSSSGTILNSSFLTGLNYTPQQIAIGAAFVPVPEPGTVALLGCGLVLLGGWQIRRKLSRIANCGAQTLPEQS